MATLERAQKHFEGALFRLTPLVQQLDASAAANDSLSTPDLPHEPDTPLWKLYLPVLNEAVPAWTEVAAALDLLWPKPLSGTAGRVSPDRLTLGEVGMELMEKALRYSDKTSVDDYVAAQRWSLLFENAIRAFLKLHAPQVPARAAGAVAAAPAALPPRPVLLPPASPAKPSISAQLAGTATPPERHQEAYRLFSIPPSSKKVEPTVHAAPGAVAAEAVLAQPEQYVGEFGGVFEGGGANGEPDQQEAQEDEEDQADEAGMDFAHNAVDDDGDGSTSSEETKDSDYQDSAEEGVRAGQKRVRCSAGRPLRGGKHPRIATSPDEEDEVDAASRDFAPTRKATRSPSRRHRSPSQSPEKPAQAKPARTYDSAFDPFNPSSWEIPSLDHPARLTAQLATPYVRQPASAGLARLKYGASKVRYSISHNDIGGAMVSVIGKPLCLTSDRNHGPVTPGASFLLTFSSQKKWDLARKRLEQEPSHSISVFVRTENGRWHYQGEYREVAEPPSFLRGGPAFTDLPQQEQDDWVDLLHTRVVRRKLADVKNTWKMKLTKEACDKAAVRSALEKQAKVMIEYVRWRCTGFDETKIKQWHDQIKVRQEYVRMLSGEKEKTPKFIALCKASHAKAVVAAKKKAEEERRKAEARGEGERRGRL
ncbi:hypothetical protein JCM11251_007412 [Rhodosporidiobolus azoricus]